jgi:gliding motility-associated-like protein
VDAQISDGGILYGCVPQTIHFQSLNQASGSVLWNFGDNTSDSGSSATHTYITTGHYVILLTVSDTATCNLTDTATFSLDVYAMPRPGFFYAGQKPYYPSTAITFVDTSAFASSIFWDFGDDTFSSDSVVKHAYRKGGSYDICLTATSEAGCADSVCRTIEVEAAESIYVPNSFTPNHDGNNDYFFPVTLGVLEMKVRIFNRWGVLIKEWDGLDGYWDGRTNGHEAPSDVYLYQIDAVGSITPSFKKSAG